MDPSTRQGAVPAGAALSGAPEASVQPAPTLRAKFVLGVFTGADAAEKSLHRLEADADGMCEVLVLSGDGDAPAVGPETAPSEIASMVRDRLLRATAFEPLVEPSRELDPCRKERSAGTPRPFQNIVHHLAGGATLVIVRVGSSEQQLHSSRVFLDAGCEVLLTYELKSPAAG